MGKRAKLTWGLISLTVIGGLAVWRYGLLQGPVSVFQTATTGRPTESAKMHNDQISQSKLMAGVVEGFYGPKWSNSATKQMLRFMRHEGLNTFVYAPKNDPYLRAQWNQLYPSSNLKRLAELVNTAKANQIQFVCSISPGLSIDYASVRDQHELMAKINQLWSIGIRSFMLSFDDIPVQLPQNQAQEYHNNLALAQCQLVDKIYSQQHHQGHDINILFTPTEYWGLTNNMYWHTLKTRLNAQIPVIWTGPDVLSKTITHQEVLSVKHHIGHPLVIWDNYPVNDYTYVIKHHPQLFMGPVNGRGPHVLGALRGYLFNPMLQPYASELALATGASYLEHPLTYNPQSAWLQALTMWRGPTRKALKSFAGANSVSYLDGVPLDHLNNHIVSFWTSYGQHKNLLSTPLYKQFERWKESAAVLHHGLSAPFYEEIRPWLRLYQQEAELGIQVSDALAHPQLTTAATAHRLIAQQAQISGSVRQLGVHVILQGWFTKSFHQPPFNTP